MMNIFKRSKKVKEISQIGTYEEELQKIKNNNWTEKEAEQWIRIKFPFICLKGGGIKSLEGCPKSIS